LKHLQALPVFPGDAGEFGNALLDVRHQRNFPTPETATRTGARLVDAHPLYVMHDRGPLHARTSQINQVAAGVLVQNLPSQEDRPAIGDRNPVRVAR
jgi:hypothetical protein